jgi:2-polyprenyl-6-methoxyphenol hydroxylase-like FAD-dependent oxidoreductase
MTTSTPARVVIIGGGIGGLCLAHGLRRAGIPVTVYERTHRREDWLQGYRIHINPDGAGALQACLPDENWQAFLAATSDGEGGFGFLTEQLTPLLDLPAELLNGDDADPAHRHHGVSRVGLRAALLRGLDGAVAFGRTFERYELTDDGRVRAHFDDGSAATADLLVGADGANSRVRHQLLPGTERIDTGVIAVAGKYRLTAARRRSLPEVLTSRVNSILPLHRGSLFTAAWQADPRLDADEDHGDRADLLFDETSDYILWGYADAASRLPVDGLDGAGLQQLVADRTRTWSPHLQELITGADPATVNALTVRSAYPVGPWPTGAVTLLGDAIHNMTPMGGIGANTALRDADLLRRQLTIAGPDPAAWRAAVRAYEREMLDYGFAAVRLSLRNTRQAGSANTATRLLFRTILRLANGVPPLKQRMFVNHGRAPT